MKILIPIVIGLLVVGCGKKEDGNTGVVNPNKLSPKAVPANIDNPILEKAIRKSIKKPTGELSKKDLEKVERLDLGMGLTNNKLTEVPKGLEKLTKLTNLLLSDNKLTDVTGLEKLTKLEKLYLNDNPDLTKAQIVELQKALPKCRIFSNPKR